MSEQSNANTTQTSGQNSALTTSRTGNPASAAKAPDSTYNPNPAIASAIGLEMNAFLARMKAHEASRTSGEEK